MGRERYFGSSAVARMACIEVYRYLLQILLVRRQDWESLPCVVVTEDLPGGTILDASREARNGGVRVGMRFAAALSLVPHLRAGTVSSPEQERADQAILKALNRLSPAVESFRSDPGVFWVGTEGMQRIFAAPGDWGSACREEVLKAGFRCRVAMGWTRAGTYAAAKAGGARGVRIFTSREEEDAALDAAPLTLLPFTPRDREQLLDLGIETIGAFRLLPAGSIRRRFGPAVREVHQFLHAPVELPVISAEPEREKTYGTACPYPLRKREELAFCLEALLRQAAPDLQRYAESIAGVKLEFHTENGGSTSREVRPARPTRDLAFLEKLINLRLEGLDLGMEPHNGVVRCALHVETVPISVRQGSLLHARGDNGDRVVSTISLLRAHFGNGAVGRLALEEGFIPEEIVAWSIAECAPPVQGGIPRERMRSERVLVRRVLNEPVPIRVHKKGGSVAAVLWERAGGSSRSMRVVRSLGPYVLSGRWWAVGYDREYYYLELQEGPMLWVYRNTREGSWVLQGTVE